MLGGTAIVGLVQLLYAALTARLLPPGAFGSYAVALSGVGLIAMLGGSTLGESAARRSEESPEVDRSLMGSAALLGTLVAFVIVVMAPLWGALWGVPESAATTRVLALGVPLASAAAVAAGVLRRSGATASVALRVSVGQVAGMAIALPMVALIRDPWTLGLNSLLSSTLGFLLLLPALPRDRRMPSRPRRTGVDDLVYGAKASGLNLARFGLNTLPVWAIGRGAGAAALGEYNRATAVVTLPIEALQRSFTYSLFPELRPGGAGTRTPDSFTKLIAVLTWVAMGLSGIGYFAAAPFVLLVLGEGWEEAAAIAGLVLLLGTIPILAAPCAALLEALGVFRPSVFAWVAQAIAVGVGTVVTLSLGVVPPALVGMVAGSLVGVAVLIVSAAGRGLLNARAYFSLVVPILGLQLIATLVLLGMSPLQAEAQPLAALLRVLGVALVELTVGLVFLRRSGLYSWTLDRLRTQT